MIDNYEIYFAVYAAEQVACLMERSLIQKLGAAERVTVS